MEISNSVDQRHAAAHRFLAEHRDALARQGAVVPTWRRRGDRRVGPYYLLVCRVSNGGQRSLYLGRSGPLVVEVSAALSLLQLALREKRRLATARRQLRSGLTKAKRALDSELEKIGLTRKGMEVRGWSKIGQGALSLALEQAR